MIPNVNFTHFVSHTLKFCRIPKYDYYFERGGVGGGGGVGVGKSNPTKYMTPRWINKR